MDESPLIPIRVREGVALLNRVIPDWKTKIDIEKFSIKRSDVCILGQLFGQTWEGYFKGLKSLRIETPVNYGFGIGVGQNYITELEKEWLTQLTT